MSVKRKVQRIGGSLGVILPRDFAQSMKVENGTEMRLTLLNRGAYLEPADQFADEGAFRRAFAAVLRSGVDLAAKDLAAYDRGEKKYPR